MIKYIDNLLPKNYHEQLLAAAKSKLEYRYLPTTTYVQTPIENVSGVFDVGQFVCTVYNPPQARSATSEKHFEFVKPMIYLLEAAFNLEILKIIRVKFNLLLQRPDCPEGAYNYPHVDLNPGDGSIFSCIYYLNDSDGDTVLFNEFIQGKRPDNFTVHSRYKPTANSALIFDVKRFHASSTPRLTKTRHVINFVFSATVKPVV